MDARVLPSLARGDCSAYVVTEHLNCTVVPALTDRCVLISLEWINPEVPHLAMAAIYRVNKITTREGYVQMFVFCVMLLIQAK